MPIVPLFFLADDPISQARTAIAPAVVANDVILSGTGTVMGASGKYSLRLGPKGSVVITQTSELGQTVGYDGTNVWECDYTGAPRAAELSQADRDLASLAMYSMNWVRPGAPFSLTPGPDANTIQVQAKGQYIVQTVTLDPSTHLPVKSTFPSPAGVAEIDFKDWRKTPRGMLPFNVAVTEGGQTDSVQFTTMSREPTAPNAFTIPKWTASDTSFDASVSPELETKRLISGHIVVHPKVDGKDIGWFILDSGAEGMCIDQTAADDLKLTAVGKVPAVGVGGVVAAKVVKADTLELGPMTVKNLAFVELDLAQIGKMLKLPLGGIIGYDVFRRCVLALDVTTPKVTLMSPDRMSLPVDHWEPIKFEGGVIGVNAEFEGNQKGWFRLDTGAAGTVSFHAPYVEKHHLLDNRKLSSTLEGGVGGMVQSKSGTIDYFALGGHRFEQPVAKFSTAKIGAFQNDWLVGNIGQDFMNPFTIVFDYPKARIAFEPKK